jgi:Big-like domain-containing protein
MREYLRSKTRFLNLILTFAFTAITVCGQQNSSEAYFIFDYPPDPRTFVIKLTDSQIIQQARDILSTGTPKIISGTIIKQPVYYNAPWSYHLDPKSIAFVDAAVELCDAGMGYLENNLDTAYPGWCPWGSRLVREIPAPAKPGSENLPPTISMTFPHADNTYTTPSPGSITLVANADDADGSIAKVSFSNGSVIGETTTYPYKFTWSSLAPGIYTVSATAIDNNGVSTSSRTVTFLVNGGPPLLLTDGDTSKAAALESVTLLQEPFAVSPEHFLSSDQRTRLLLFGINLELRLGETISAITVRGEDSQHQEYSLPLEAVRGFPTLPGVTQLTVKLPEELRGLGQIWVSVSLRGVQSNKVTVKIK